MLILAKAKRKIIIFLLLYNEWTHEYYAVRLHSTHYINISALKIKTINVLWTTIKYRSMYQTERLTEKIKIHIQTGTTIYTSKLQT